MSFRILFLLAAALVLNVGCGGEEPYRKPTSPAKGKVTVDGQPPGSGVQVECHPVGGPDTVHPTVSMTETDADGNFSISTYASGDGLPVGEYVLVFSWQEFHPIARSYTGPDKLNGRYSDPETSTFKVSVKEGEEIDLGVIALTTK